MVMKSTFVFYKREVYEELIAKGLKEYTRKIK